MIRERSPLAGQTLTIRADAVDLGGQQYHVEDWWQNVTGGSWMDAEGNPAALKYAIRSAIAGLPTDNEVLYGKAAGGLGHLVHVTELDTTPAAPTRPGRDFLFVDTDPLEGAYAEEDNAYAEGWEAPGDREHDNPIACPPDCYIAKDYTTADPSIGAVDSCSEHKPKTMVELRAAVEASRR